MKSLSALAFILALASCTSMKPLVFTNNRQASAENKKEVKFLDISSDDQSKKLEHS